MIWAPRAHMVTMGGQSENGVMLSEEEPRHKGRLPRRRRTTTRVLIGLAVVLLLSRTWRENRWQDAPLLGLLLGAAMATKLLAVFAAFAIVPLAVWSLTRSASPRRRAAALGTAALVLLATGGVPYLYAWKASGNPVLPYLNLVFQSPHFPAYNFHDTRWTQDLHGSILGSATVTNGQVFVSTLERETFVLDAHDGRILWRFPDGQYSPLVFDGTRGLLVGKGRIYGIVNAARDEWTLPGLRASRTDLRPGSE